MREDSAALRGLDANALWIGSKAAEGIGAGGGGGATARILGDAETATDRSGTATAEPAHARPSHCCFLLLCLRPLPFWDPGPGFSAVAAVARFFMEILMASLCSLVALSQVVVR